MKEKDFDTEDWQHIYDGCLHSILIIVGMIVALLAVVILCASCSPKVVEREVVRTDTLVQKQQVRDSIYLKDSIYIHEWQRGDTIYISTDKWHTRWRDRIQHDSIYISKSDTLMLTDIKEVPAKLTWWQQFRLSIGNICLWLIGLIALMWLIRIIRTKYF